LYNTITITANLVQRSKAVKSSPDVLLYIVFPAWY